MSAGHDHGASTANERNLWIVLGLTAAFMLAEIVGGILTKSLALISDAAHMFTAAAALAIALAAIRITSAPQITHEPSGTTASKSSTAAFDAVVLFRY